MMQIHPVPAFEDNYLWVVEDGRHAAVVDPGDAAPVQAFLEANGLALTAILVTHHHGDHVGGVEGAGRTLEMRGLRAGGRADRRGHEAAARGRPASRCRGWTWRSRCSTCPATPRGTSPTSGEGVVFCGDTLFACGCGRLFEGTPAQMLDSLVQARAAAGRDSRLLRPRVHDVQHPFRAGRGAGQREARRPPGARRGAAGENVPTVPSTIADELDTNPFLRWASPEVIASASNLAGRPLASPVEVFTAVREWKNNFR